MVDAHRADLKCPRCSTTAFSNPNLNLMSNECGHILCTECIEILFARNSSKCYKCDKILIKSNYSETSYDDEEINKDLYYRKKIFNDFNLNLENFETEEEYDDYLEDVEEIIDNLKNNVKINETKSKIELHKKKYRQQILHNRKFLSKEQQELEDLINQAEKNKQEFEMSHKSDQLDTLSKTMLEKETLLSNIKDDANPTESLNKFNEAMQNIEISNEAQDEIKDNHEHESKPIINIQSLHLKDYKEYDYRPKCIHVLNCTLKQFAAKKYHKNEDSVGGYRKWYNIAMCVDSLIYNY
ncbi:MAG: CDK-activating kinase assembly factor MAT1 [Marteilia pararefringens]